jgi:hypothetical protein
LVPCAEHVRRPPCGRGWAWRGRELPQVRVPLDDRRADDLRLPIVLAARLMDRHGVKRLPVVDADGVSEGVVTVSGVVSKHTEAIAAVAASRDALTAAAG